MAREYLRKIAIPPSSSIEAEFVFFEDFEGKFDWSYIRSAGAYMRKSPKAAYRGDYGIELVPNDGTMAANSFIEMRRYLRIATAPLMSVGFHVRLEDNWGNIYIPFYIEGGLYGGLEQYKAGFAIRNDTKNIYIWDHNPNWILVDTLKLTLQPYWVYIELTWNTITGKYSTLRIGNHVIDISTITIPAESGFLYWLLPQLTFMSLDTDYTSVHVDNFFVRALK